MKVICWRLLLAFLEIINGLIIIFSIGFVSPQLVLRLVRWRASRYIKKNKKISDGIWEKEVKYCEKWDRNEM